MLLLRSCSLQHAPQAEGLLLLASRCTALFSSSSSSCAPPPALLQQQQQQHHHHCTHSQQQQELPSIHTAAAAAQRLRPLPAAAQQRHFSSGSSSSWAEYSPEFDTTLVEAQQQEQQTEQRMQQELEEVLKDMPGRLLKQPLFRNNLSSKIKSRKPAIKYPARHQWHYCAEDYDPMEPLPEQRLPPYASLLAHTKDYNQILKQTMPKFHRNSYRRLWRKNVAIADQRWKQAWEAKLAAARKEEALVKRLSERIIRERSWQLWQLQRQ